MCIVISDSPHIAVRKRKKSKKGPWSICICIHKSYSNAAPFFAKAKFNSNASHWHGESVATISQGWAFVAGTAGGLPYAIYLSRRGLSKEQLRATLGICTIFSITLRVVVFIAAGLLATAKPWLCALAVLPASLTGLWVAGKAYQHLSRDLLLRLIAVMLIGSGVSLIVRGLA